MKKAAFIFTLLCAVFICLLFGCVKDGYERISKIDTEVDYGYVFVDGRGFFVNKERYDFLSIIKKKLSGNQEELYYGVYNGNKMYSLYHYNSHGKVNYVNGKYENGITFDVALIEFDLLTRECEIIYDFKNVYPTNNYSYGAPYIIRWIDDNTCTFQYNGLLQVFDLNTKTIISGTYKVYNEENYRTCEHFPYYFNEFCDFYHSENGTLYFYEYKNKDYILHELSVDENTYNVVRHGDYVYTSRYIGGVIDNKYYDYRYYDCYDLKNDQKMNYEFMMELVSADADVNNETEQPTYSVFTVNGKEYKYKFENVSNTSNGKYILEIYSGETLLVTIDNEYMSNNSSAFNELFSLYDKRISYYNCAGLKVVEDKIFILFQSNNYRWLGYSPLYVYEYDIENDKIYYVGYGSTNGLNKIILIR